MNIKDNRGLTALDIVRELPSQKSQHIAALIEGERCRAPCERDGDFGVLTVPVQAQDLVLWSWRVLEAKRRQARPGRATGRGGAGGRALGRAGAGGQLGIRSAGGAWCDSYSLNGLN